MKPIICIRNETPSDLGVGEEVLAASGFEVRYLDAHKGDRLPSPDDGSGLIVLGGGMNVEQTEDYPFLLGERRLLAEAVSRRLPVLGICLGGQLLARALGASVGPAPVGEVGFYALRPTRDARDDGLLSVYRDGDLVFQWHHDAFDLPAGTTLLATGDSVPNQAFRAGERAWGLQFHPEVTAEVLEVWLEETRSGFERDWGRTPDEVRDEIRELLPAQERRSRELFRRFAETVEAA